MGALVAVVMMMVQPWGLRAAEIVSMAIYQPSRLATKSIVVFDPAPDIYESRVSLILSEVERGQRSRSPLCLSLRQQDNGTRIEGFDFLKILFVHPHMLRHACGFKLANDGVNTRTIQAYLGHKSIQHTVRYTELAPNSVQKLIPGLTAPAASFEATVGGYSCPRLAEVFQEISMNARWGPFFFEVPAPANEEVDGTRNRPSPNISIPLHRSIKLGPPVYLP